MIFVLNCLNLVDMKRLSIAVFLVFQVCTYAQTTYKTYTLHLKGEAQDTLVYEMELGGDRTFVNRKYSKKLTDTIKDYKKWDVVIRKGTYAKEKGYYRLTQTDGDQCLNGSLLRIIFKQIWFYGQPNAKGKLSRCWAMTYHRTR